MEELEGVLDDQDIYNLRADTLARWNKFDSFQPEFPKIDPLLLFSEPFRFPPKDTKTKRDWF